MKTPEVTEIRQAVRALCAKYGEDHWLKAILDGMNAERILIAAECVGDGRYFIDKASAYATEREVFNRPIGRNQGRAVPHRPQLRGGGGRLADGGKERSAVRCGGAVRG